MCGIVGLWAPGPIAEHAVQAAVASLGHRGPDDRGSWRSADGRLLLGHTRLAILDLSPAGHQPMVSADGRLVLCFNGEIYNHLELRRMIAAEGSAPIWRGHSDSETLLAAIAAWGLETTLRRCRGMWAFALWDARARSLSLARDRFGEKPLYYGTIAGGFAFGSELKALRSLPGFDRPVDPEAAEMLLRFGYIPAPHSIHAGIHKLEPGTIVTIGTDGRAMPVTRHYHDLAEAALSGAARPIEDHGEALGALRTTLADAVGLQMVADVPVGTFLSGGIDSSLITALAVQRAQGRVRSFSIGFDEAGFDEAPYARAVAAHLGTDHHELYVGAAEAQAVIPSLPRLFDEPFGDSSQIPTYLVSRFAKGEVTVALTGDGGDELFGGYNRHRALPAAWRRLASLPQPLRTAALAAASAIPPPAWNLAARLASGTRRPDFLGEKMQRMLRIARQSPSFAAFALCFLDQRGGGRGAPHMFERHLDRLGALPPEAQVMMLDMLTYLPDDILVKVDRAAMAVGLEGRVPFLDAKVAALAARIPVRFKVGAQGGKRILRDLLAELVPPRLFERPKAGFAMPLGRWLRDDLRDWAEALLDPRSSLAGALVDMDATRASWAAHLAGRGDQSERLWPALMLEAWLREQ